MFLLSDQSLSSWSVYSAAADNNWISVVWSSERELFVAVADTGTFDRIMTSPDGEVWTTQVLESVINDWQSVCWSPSRLHFVAVASSGTGNRVIESTDGLEWNAAPSAADNDWRSVCWSPELALFVAVASSGTGNRVMTAADEEIWTIRTSAADNDWRSVCWSSELALFVAVASSGTGNRVMTSPDGITWTIRTSAADNDWRSVCWSPELALFVAVASSGTGNRVMTSRDAVTWTIRTSAADNDWRSVCWATQYSAFVAVSDNASSDRVMTSRDGVTWILQPSDVTGPTLNTIAYRPNSRMFVAVGGGSAGSTVRVMAGPPRIELHSEWDFRRRGAKVESRTRASSGRVYDYRWGDHDAVAFSVMGVSSATQAIVNSWWSTNTDLVLWEGLTTVVSGHLTNDAPPINTFTMPYSELYSGRIELGGY